MNRILCNIDYIHHVLQECLTHSDEHMIELAIHYVEDLREYHEELSDSIKCFKNLLTDDE